MTKLEQQSEKIAVESVRLQSFLHALDPQRPTVSKAVGESPQSSPLTFDPPKVGGCKIVCTLDGKEPAVILYDKFAGEEKRTFPNSRHAFAVQEYLRSRASGMRWEAEPPIYEIVAVEE
jgi:hypothetical protein